MGQRSSGAATVLYVDSDEAYAASLLDALGAHGQLSVEHVPDVETALARLRSASFDCVLARRDLDGTDAMTLLTRAREASPGIPFVLLVPAEAAAAAVAAGTLRAGANDYFVQRDPETTAQVAADRLTVTGAHQRPGIDYQQVFEEATVGIIVHHPETGDIVDINPWMSELLGYDRSELLTMTVGDFSAGEEPYTQEQAERHIRRAATEGPQTFEWLDERADGERVWVEVSLRRTVIGGHDRVLAIVRDITERKEREASLERQRQRMEEFAGVVSHDLRSPLTVAQGWLDRALDEPETTDEATLERIEGSLDRMNEMIEDSLTLVREGGDVAETEPVPVADEAPEWWKVSDTGDAELVVDVPFAVEADAERLQRLFENLFQNCVTHGGASDDDDLERSVTVRTGPVTVDAPDEPVVGPFPDDGPVEGFYVADDGPGIPTDEREQVFETGYTTDADGTGLGLAIVRRVAEAHGWAIRLRESESGGARFEFLDVTLHEPDDDGER